MIRVLLLVLLLAGCATKEAAVACQVADVMTTKAGLNTGAEEGNPLMRKVGFEGMVALKAVLLWFTWQADSKPANTVVALVGCGAAAHNLAVIF